MPIEQRGADLSQGWFKMCCVDFNSFKVNEISNTTAKTHWILGRTAELDQPIRSPNSTMEERRDWGDFTLVPTGKECLPFKLLKIRLDQGRPPPEDLG